MAHWVFLPCHSHTQAFQMLIGGASHRVLHHVIVLTVQAQGGDSLLARRQLQFIAEGGGVGGEGDYASQRALPFQIGGVQDHCAPL